MNKPVSDQRLNELVAAECIDGRSPAPPMTKDELVSILLELRERRETARDEVAP